MNIGIIVHSKTGCTYSAAQRLEAKLTSAGHKVDLQRLEPIGDAYPGVKDLKLKSLPKADSYDGLIFAAPVWAFGLSPVMKVYLAKLKSLKGKKIGVFVTMGFPFAWMGGNNSINQFRQACESKGGTVSAAAVIGRSGKDEKALNELMGKMNTVF